MNLFLSCVLRATVGAFLVGSAAHAAPSFAASSQAGPFAEGAGSRLPGKSFNPDFFGTVALRLDRTPLDHQWARARSGQVRNGGEAVVALLARARALGENERLTFINSWVNHRIRYRSDQQLHGRPDYWATAGSTLSKGEGDCEDMAILKMHLLVAAGVRAEKIFLSIVRDLGRGADHAVLVVLHDGMPVVLDNMADRPLDGRSTALFSPIFTYGAGGPWIHGFDRKSSLARRDGLPSEKPYRPSFR